VWIVIAAWLSLIVAVGTINNADECTPTLKDQGYTSLFYSSPASKIEQHFSDVQSPHSFSF